MELQECFDSGALRALKIRGEVAGSRDQFMSELASIC